MKLKYNSKGVDRSKSQLEAPQPGVYKMKIVEAKYEKKTKDHEERVVFRLQTTDPSAGKGNGWHFYDYVNTSVDWKIDQYLQAALGIDTEEDDEGEFDTTKMVGKTVRGRVKSGTYNDEYSPKLAAVLPEEDSDDDDEDDLDDEDDELDDEDEDGDEEGDDDDDEDDDADALDFAALRKVARKADKGDEDAQSELNEIAEERFDLDPDEFETWAEMVDQFETLESGDDEDEDDDPEDEDDEDDDEDDEDDDEDEPDPEPAPKSKSKGKKKKYEDMSVDELKAELERRELPSRGSQSALIARLKKNDADPFDD